MFALFKVVDLEKREMVKVSLGKMVMIKEEKVSQRGINGKRK